ncbi:phage baseplate assembly protein V [Dickeya solani]|uniref:Phage baseplate assembly protein V n=1 Tax=Dickeya solani TaxID=1089444 RepID=A0ABU4EIJ5_9GAMM|nr:phage baseplate assembly protein V [Dickeya solani]MCZ0823717.1 phage baseplate assembly protein V [Dickeya solani]MDV6995624.1 phage baseplate assembly protein V [Dickeya solani]MDV7002903.1 phage baseplate assembly protein V [Dickeya solani]MDV7036679.1 phage baseplate assembly protein V [Dickeya solani]MDV7043432.1 phage baseplate assembly protein V [Dickeya solani]
MSNPFSVLQRSLSNLLARAVVTGLNTATKCQLLQIKMAADELKADIEHIEPYGFTSAPHAGAEAVAVYMDGDRSHGVVLVVGDRRYRIAGLQAGEVALYTDEGDSVILKRGRVIEVTTETFIVNATEKMTVNTPLLEVPTGDISDKRSTLQSVRNTFNDHTHPGDSGGTTDIPNQAMG